MTILAEVPGFRSFIFETQRYICRAFEMGSTEEQAVQRWARASDEATAIWTQAHIHRVLLVIGAATPVGSVASAEISRPYATSALSEWLAD
ncbi:MAG: hypothetical protein JWN69_379 [Alphaproteobacteria bacterium]|nr:hypothetical protein [Alphaproteobacteria bacterium]